MHHVTLFAVNPFLKNLAGTKIKHQTQYIVLTFE